MSTDLSIVIVNWNTCELLAACLDSVFRAGTMEAAAAPALGRIEVFVVDNASTDGSVDMVSRRFPTVEVIRNVKNVGFGRANNQAIKRCSGRYTLLLNSDTVLSGGAISSLLGVADVHPEAGVIGCMLRNPDGSFQASYNDFPGLVGEWLSAAGLATRLLRPQYPSYGEACSQVERYVDWIPGAAMLFRTDALQQLGGFDERYEMYSEETDICWRLRKAGWSVLYTPTVRIVHLGGASASRASAKQVFELYRSKKLFFRRAKGGSSALLFGVGVRLVTAGKIAAWTAALLVSPPLQRVDRLRKIQSHANLVVRAW